MEPLATSHALYLSIDQSIYIFCLKINLHPSGLLPNEVQLVPIVVMHKWTQIHYSQHLSNMELLERTWPIYMFEVRFLTNMLKS